MDFIIYKIINKINGKVYIGQDSNNNPEYYGSGKLIKRAISKYGKENFIKEVIEYVRDIDDMDVRETYWIDYYNSVDPEKGYNINPVGGKPPRLYDLPEEQQKLIKQKWSEKRKDVVRDSEYCQKLSDVMSKMYQNKQHPTKGRKCTEQEVEFKRQKAYEQKLGGDVFNTLSTEKQTELREKTRQRMLGNKVSEETRKRISEKLKQSYKDGKRSNKRKSGL